MSRPRPPEPLQQGPLDVFTEEQWRKITRLTGLTLAIIYMFIFASWMFLYELEVEECPPFKNVNAVRVEEVPFKSGRTYHDKNFIYRLMKYKLYGSAELKNGESKKEEIIVIFIPSSDMAPSGQQHLAKIIRDQSTDLSFRFIWYALDFNNEIIIANGWHFANQQLFLKRSMEFLERRHIGKKFVIIGFSYGGAIAQSLLAFESVKVQRNLTGMIVFEVAPTKNPPFLVDSTTQSYYFACDDKWKKAPESDIGLLSYSGGLRSPESHHSASKVRRAVHIPSWTINGAPDCGVSYEEAVTCSAFVSHVADLFIEYGKRHKEATGKEIVRKFVADYESAKVQKLPDAWNKEWLPHPSTVTTGRKFEFVVNQQQWLEVKLERDEHIQMKFISPCLKAVTLIRGRKHIRRKEEFLDGVYLNFGVYDWRMYEEVRILLESDESCEVIVETSSSLWKYITRFEKGIVRDTHQLFLGGLLAKIYLMTLEGDSRSVRFAKQLEFYGLIVAATLYQAFHSIGLPSAGLLIGAGLFATFFLIMSATQRFLLIMYHKTLEQKMGYGIEEMQTLAGIGLFVTFVSRHYGFLTMYFAFLVPNRVFAAITGVTTLVPLLSRSFMSTYCFTMNNLKCPQMYAVAIPVIHFVLQLTKIQLTRNILYLNVCIIITIQMCYSHYSMDVHYTLDMLLLVFIANTPSYTPPELYNANLRLAVLEAEEEEANQNQAKEEPISCSIL